MTHRRPNGIRPCEPRGARLAALLGALLLPVMAVAQPAQGPLPTPTRERALAVAREIVQAARYATMATVAGGRDPRARIVDPFPPDADFTLWVATNPRSRKVAELKAAPNVTLLYFNAAGSEYVSVRGTATLVTDPEAKAAHWKDEWAAFYDGGPRGPNYLLIKVVPRTLEVVSPGRGFDTDPATWRPFTVELRPGR